MSTRQQLNLRLDKDTRDMLKQVSASESRPVTEIVLNYLVNWETLGALAKISEINQGVEKDQRYLKINSPQELIDKAVWNLLQQIMFADEQAPVKQITQVPSLNDLIWLFGIFCQAKQGTGGYYFMKLDNPNKNYKADGEPPYMWYVKSKAVDKALQKKLNEMKDEKK